MQQCTDLPHGFYCSCTEGFVVSPIDHKSCIDLDECAFSKLNNCSQVCTNTKGSFSCGCYPGFAPNGKNCIAADVPTMFLANGNEIRQFKINRAGTGAYDSVVGNESRINAIDYDITKGKTLRVDGAILSCTELINY